jgi:hypothetical protein
MPSWGAWQNHQEEEMSVSISYSDGPQTRVKHVSLCVTPAEHKKQQESDAQRLHMLQRQKRTKPVPDQLCPIVALAAVMTAFHGGIYVNQKRAKLGYISTQGVGVEIVEIIKDKTSKEICKISAVYVEFLVSEGLDRRMCLQLVDQQVSSTFERLLRKQLEQGLEVEEYRKVSTASAAT